MRLNYKTKLPRDYISKEEKINPNIYPNKVLSTPLESSQIQFERYPCTLLFEIDAILNPQIHVLQDSPLVSYLFREHLL